jgi:hypothetical protein
LIAEVIGIRTSCLQGRVPGEWGVRVSVIANLEREISECIRDYRNGGQESLAAALSVVARPSVFLNLVNSITRDNERFSDVVRSSVVHPNGFAKIVLLYAADYRLRLHVWGADDRQESDAQESIHNHRWDFAAAIVAGAYRHQEYQVCEDGELFCRYRYQPAEDRRSYMLVPAGTHTLRCVFDVRLAQGSSYSMASPVLHRVVPDLAHPAVSLVLEGPHQPTLVDVFTESNLRPKASAPFIPLSAETLRRHLSAIAALPAFIMGSP